MNIDDEKPISFTNNQYIEASYSIKDLIGERETCNYNEYDRRIAICRSCDSCVADNELCTENGELARVYCRLIESRCPLQKW